MARARRDSGALLGCGVVVAMLTAAGPGCSQMLGLEEGKPRSSGGATNEAGSPARSGKSGATSGRGGSAGSKGEPATANQ